MAFRIVRNDITKMDTEAIVNTAAARAEVGSGCDSAVYKAAGYDELLNYRKEIGKDFVSEGDVFITPGFKLPAKYIIHAVSPEYRGGDCGEEEKLRSCYRKSLMLAKENNITSVAFPLIATGSFGYPKEEGIRIAADEINAFLLRNEMDIFLVVFDDYSTGLGKRVDPRLEAYIDRNYVERAGIAEYDGRDAFRRSAQCMDFSEQAAYVPPAPSPMAAGARNEACLPPETRSPEVKKPLRSRLFGKKSKAAQPKDTFYDFEGLHESKLEERMRHMSDTYSEYLMYLIQERHMENAEVWKRAIVDKKIFSKIKNNVNYHPNKLTALCLCIGAKLNLDESKDLLARAGYALSPCDKTDIIFSYFIENEIYDMIELDIQLEEHGLPCIIA